MGCSAKSIALDKTDHKFCDAECRYGALQVLDSLLGSSLLQHFFFLSFGECLLPFQV
jgi:hypothetical protein